MHARQSLGLFFILVLCLAGCGKSASVLAADAPEDQQTLEMRLKQLQVSRVQTARQSRDATLAAFQADTVTLGDLLTATRNLLTAELAVAKTPGQRIAAHKRHVEDVRQCEQKIEALFDVGARGGEAEKYATARYHRETAEIALVEACIAAGLPYPTFDAAFDLPARPQPVEQ
jgi:hypothetical protein